MSLSQHSIFSSSNSSAGSSELTVSDFLAMRSAPESTPKLSFVEFEVLQSLQQLEQFGLTGNHLRSWRPCQGGYLSWAHEAALVYLIRDQRIAPAVAIQEINGLNKDQSSTLLELYKDGLRRSHLRSWISGQGDSFSIYQKEALVHLIREQHFAPAVAILEINYLSANKSSTLKKLYKDGLRGDHLRSWSGSKRNNIFTFHHKEALVYLIREQHVAPAVAIQEINQLTSKQILRIANGETKEQILYGSGQKPNL